MHHLRRVALPAAIALLLLTLLPIEAGLADAATSRWTANCTVNLRSHPTTTATRRTRIATGQVVTASAKVSGGWYSTTCGKAVSGHTWLAITAIGSRTVKSLYGVSTVYAASALFRQVAPPACLYCLDICQWNGTIDSAEVPAA